MGNVCVCEGRSVANVCVKDDLWAMCVWRTICGQCVCEGRSVGNGDGSVQIVVSAFL